MDYDLWLKIARQFKVAYLPQLLAHYRWLDNNKTATGGRARLDEISRVVAAHGANTPAYVRLEYVNHHLQQARQSARHGRIRPALADFARATGKLFGSHRSVISMFQPRTWKIIWTGQVLRARAAREGDGEDANER